MYNNEKSTREKLNEYYDKECKNKLGLDYSGLYLDWGKKSLISKAVNEVSDNIHLCLFGDVNSGKTHCLFQITFELIKARSFIHYNVDKSPLNKLGNYLPLYVDMMEFEKGYKHHISSGLRFESAVFDYFAVKGIYIDFNQNILLLLDNMDTVPNDREVEKMIIDARMFGLSTNIRIIASGRNSQWPYKAIEGWCNNKYYITTSREVKSASAIKEIIKRRYEDYKVESIFDILVEIAKSPKYTSGIDQFEIKKILADSIICTDVDWMYMEKEVEDFITKTGLMKPEKGQYSFCQSQLKEILIA